MNVLIYITHHFVCDYSNLVTFHDACFKIFGGSITNINLICSLLFNKHLINSEFLSKFNF